jgi:hypothetical protein
MMDALRCDIDQFFVIFEFASVHDARSEPVRRSADYGGESAASCASMQHSHRVCRQATISPRGLLEICRLQAQDRFHKERAGTQPAMAGQSWTI